MSHFDIFLSAQRTVKECYGNGSVRQRLDILYLGVQQAGAEHEVKCSIQIQNLLIQINNSNLASTAGCSPVECQFRFFRHFVLR